MAVPLDILDSNLETKMWKRDLEIKDKNLSVIAVHIFWNLPDDPIIYRLVFCPPKAVKHQMLSAQTHLFNHLFQMFSFCYIKGQISGLFFYLLKQEFCCSTLLKDSCRFSCMVFHRAHNAIRTLHQSYNNHRRGLKKEVERLVWCHNGLSFHLSHISVCQTDKDNKRGGVRKHSRQMFGVLHLMQAPASLQASA